MALGACSSGGDDATGSTSSAPVTSPPASATTAPSVEAVPTTVAPSAAPTTVDSGEPVFSGDPDSEWCTAAQEVEDASNRLDGIDFTDPEAVKAAFDEMHDRMQAALPSVPAEIRADVELSAQGFEELQDALRAVDYDFLNADLSLLDQRSAEMDAANINIEAYNEQVCGIATDATDATDDTATDGGFDAGAGTIREQAVAELVRQGFTQTEAECLFDNIDFTDPEIASDPTKIFPVFDTCGIDLARIAELGA